MATGRLLDCCGALIVFGLVCRLWLVAGYDLREVLPKAGTEADANLDPCI